MRRAIVPTVILRGRRMSDLMATGGRNPLGAGMVPIYLALLALVSLGALAIIVAFWPGDSASASPSPREYRSAPAEAHVGNDGLTEPGALPSRRPGRLHRM
ncbi:MAG: hypothetical protein AB7O32_02505 [Vicinamibacterales bacterium]